MASYQTISFTVGHAPSRRYNTSRIQDIYLRFRLNNGIERVEFRHRGELLSKPEHVCWQPAIMDRGGGSHDAIFHYRSCSQPAALVVTIITQSDLKGEFVYNARGEKSSEKQWVVLEKVLSWRQRWSVRSLTEDRTFWIELEMFDAKGNSRQTVADIIENSAHAGCKVVGPNRDDHKSIRAWKIVDEASLRYSLESPGCSKFELISPILCGESGLWECRDVMEGLRYSSIVDAKVNQSMGFHVYVRVAGYSLTKLKKLCQNWVKFEEAIDAFTRTNRRGGSDIFCQSNKCAILNPSGTNAELNGGRHKAMEACKNLQELCRLMNPGGRYHKLSLENLSTGKQPTVEFRQHSATTSVDAVLAWIRFCVIFVKKSGSNPTPKFLRNDMAAKEQFNELFDDLIQCRALKDFYEDRCVSIADQHAGNSVPSSRSCCNGCASGNRCSKEVSGISSSFSKWQI